jgi:hypothetical protein
MRELYEFSVLSQICDACAIWIKFSIWPTYMWHIKKLNLHAHLLDCKTIWIKICSMFRRISKKKRSNCLWVELLLRCAVVNVLRSYVKRWIFKQIINSFVYNFSSNYINHWYFTFTKRQSSPKKTKSVYNSSSISSSLKVKIRNWKIAEFSGVKFQKEIYAIHAYLHISLISKFEDFLLLVLKRNNYYSWP